MKKLLSVVLVICFAVFPLTACSGDKEKAKAADSKAAKKPARSADSKTAAQADQVEKPVVLIKTSEGDIYVELFRKSAPETVANFIGLATGKKTFTDNSGKKVTRPFYDNLIFHRVIKNFMIQGGCPKGTGTGGPGYNFADEINGKSLGLDKLKVITNNRPHRWLLIRTQRDYYMNVLAPLYRKMGITSNEILKQRREEILKRVKNLTLLEAYSNLGYKYNDKLKSYPLKRGVIAMANSGPNTNGSQFFINVIDTPWLTGKHTVFGQVVRGMDIVDKISKVPAGPGSKPVKPVKIISIRPFDRKKIPAK